MSSPPKSSINFAHTVLCHRIHCSIYSSPSYLFVITRRISIVMSTHHRRISPFLLCCVRRSIIAYLFFIHSAFMFVLLWSFSLIWIFWKFVLSIFIDSSFSCSAFCLNFVLQVKISLKSLEFWIELKSLIDFHTYNPYPGSYFTISIILHIIMVQISTPQIFSLRHL